MRPTSTTEKLLGQMQQNMERMQGSMERMQGSMERMQDALLGQGERMERIERRLVDSEIRVATALTDVVGTMVQVRDLLAVRLDDRDTVRDLDRRVRRLEERIG